MSARRTESRKAKHASENEHAAKLLEIVGSGWMAQATFVAAKLRIADLLADGPRTNADLAAAMGVHAPSLHRLLRALTTIDICNECSDGSFEITAMGSLLGMKAAASLHSWTIWSGGSMWPVWGNLLYSVTTGKSARALLTRTSAFQHLEGDPEAAAVFNQALVELTRLASRSIVRAYDFSRLRRIVPERLERSTDHQSVVRSDLHMLVALAAKERTEAEFRDLLEATGFNLTQALPVGMGLSVMVACPAE